jgi:hypothetical protein
MQSQSETGSPLFPQPPAPSIATRPVPDPSENDRIDPVASVPARASAVERARSLWDTVELVVERAILTAESFEKYDGAGKKNFVSARALEFLRSVERKQDRIPDRVEPVAFWAIEQTLDWVVERVFRRLSAEGRL